MSILPYSIHFFFQIKLKYYLLYLYKVLGCSELRSYLIPPWGSSEMATKGRRLISIKQLLKLRQTLTSVISFSSHREIGN